MMVIIMRKRRIKVSDVAAYVVVILTSIFFLFPLTYFLLIAFKHEEDILNIFATRYTIENFVKLLTEGALGEPPEAIIIRPLLNTVIISSTATVITLVVSLLAAYSVARFNFKGKEALSYFVLGQYMAPPIVALVPLWHITTTLGLLDTHIILIWCYTMFGIPLAFWMLRSFIMTSTPVELEEAALIDGCSRIGALIHVVLPLLRPGMAVTFILTFLFNWNEFLFASTLTATKAYTITVSIAKFGAWLYITWTEMAALCFITLLPVIILAILIQRYIVSGLTLGAVRA